MIFVFLLSAVLANQCSDYAAPILQSCPHPTKDFIREYYSGNVTTSPDRSCNLCPSEPRLRHSLIMENAFSTFVEFHNDLPDPVHMFWVNGEGKEMHKGVLRPFGRIRTSSMEGHVFRFYDKHRTFLLEYLVGLFPLYNDNNIQSDSETAHGPLKENDINRFGEPDWNTVLPTGFVNRAGANIDLYWEGWNGQELAGQLRPGEVHREYTYEKHEFQARIHHSKEILSTIKINAIHVPDCPRLKNVCNAKVEIVEPIYLKTEEGETCSEENMPVA